MSSRDYAFVRNDSGEAQSFRHSLLAQLTHIPVAPGFDVVVVNMRATIEPDQCFRVPKRVWNTTPCLMNRNWATKISQEEYNKAQRPTDHAHIPDVDQIESPHPIGPPPEEPGNGSEPEEKPKVAKPRKKRTPKKVS
jgi:hypothetical protein